MSDISVLSQSVTVWVALGSEKARQTVMRKGPPGGPLRTRLDMCRCESPVLVTPK